MFAVANSALINMLMASRLIYGMARQRVLPPVLGKVHPTRRTPWVAIIFTTALAFGLIVFVSLGNPDAVAALGGTTALLLLGVFAVVNVAVLVLRKDKTAKDYFHAPTVLPIIGLITCLYLVTPLSGRAAAQYVVAGWLLVLGVVLFFVTTADQQAAGHLAEPVPRHGGPGDARPEELTCRADEVVALLSQPVPNGQRSVARSNGGSAARAGADQRDLGCSVGWSGLLVGVVGRGRR